MSYRPADDKLIASAIFNAKAIEEAENIFVQFYDGYISRSTALNRLDRLAFAIEKKLDPSSNQTHAEAISHLFLHIQRSNQAGDRNVV